ncbi:hypothetical protein, partial [Mesorhizobium sp.]|uniref:hypothetical protein n=1 Tax=Mesorhizobium sp. TaxID=1871066 RepID=UPI00257FE7AA
AQAFTRRGFDWTDRYGPIVGAAAELKAKRAIIDGEATVLGATGLPDFQALRRELGKAEVNEADLPRFRSASPQRQES